MKTLSLKLSEALDRQLAAAVAKRGISKNDLVRKALATYLVEQKKRKWNRFSP